MLENGEIDLMGGVSYTDERADTMLFMGEDKYYLYADTSSTDISADDVHQKLQNHELMDL